MSKQSHKVSNQDAGFSLIEVLIALLVLSIGLLGLALLQVESIKYNTDAYFRTQATILAYDIMDRMKANKAVANAGGYQAVASPADPACGGSTPCADTTLLAAYDLLTWYANLSALLPTDPANPSKITSVGNVHTIEVHWTERGISKQRIWTIEL